MAYVTLLPADPSSQSVSWRRNDGSTVTVTRPSLEAGLASGFVVDSTTAAAWILEAGQHGLALTAVPVTGPAGAPALYPTLSTAAQALSYAQQQQAVANLAAGLGDLELTVATDYTTLPTGPVPAAAGTGQPVTIVGPAMAIGAGGLYLPRPSGSSPAASYLHRPGPAGGVGSSRVQFRFPFGGINAGATTVTASVTLIAWDQIFNGSTFPSAAMHVAISLGTWSVYVVDPNNGGPVLLGTGSWAGTLDTVYTVHARIVGNRTILTLPDGTVKEIVDARFASLSTKMAVTEIYVGQPVTDYLPVIHTDEFVAAPVIRAAAAGAPGSVATADRAAARPSAGLVVWTGTGANPANGVDGDLWIHP